MLFEKYSESEIAEALSKPFDGYPVYADRTFWNGVDRNVKEDYIARAERHRGKCAELCNLTASAYSEFRRNGNRKNYEENFFAYNDRLIEMTIAECISGEGRYLDDVVDLLYAICSIPVWCIPAHNIYYNPNDPLGDVTRPFIDLFSSEIASTVAHTAYLLGDELRRISPNLLKLVDRALKSQITEPFLKENDCWWMGYTGATLNNWSPWIISNILRVFLMYETDANAKKAAIFKSCDVLEKYFSTLPEDGECTEGAAYWDVSVGALFDCIEIMRVASHGKIDLSGNKRLRAALGYIVRSHIDKNFFLNYGDNSFVLNVDYNMISRFAETMGDDEAKAFALAQAKYAPDPKQVKEGTRYEYMRRALPAAMRRQTYAESKAEEFGDVLYARSLLFLARSPRKGGYIVSAKGRRADKGHGHLDAGSFIVYKNGPVVIDVGTETYTAKSFSCERYEIWTRRSEYHNVPVFNGTAQTYYDADLPDGKEQNLFYDGGTKLTGYFPGEVSSVEYDLTRAYASSSRLTSYLRKFTLDKNTDTLTIEERATFLGGENRTDFTFMCAERPIVSGKRLKIGAAELSFETEAEYGLKVEEIPVDDDRLRLSWGDRIWRLILGVKSGKELYVKAIFG